MIAPLPGEPLVADELKPWSASVKGRKFIWIRQNHFATRLARLGAEVLYVENPCSWASSLKQKRWDRLSLGQVGAVRQVEPRLHVMRPALSLPGSSRSDFVANINGRLLAWQIRQWARSRHWSGYLAWCRI